MTILSNTQKTVILRDSDGWYDETEYPRSYFATRREARAYRHQRLGLPDRNKRNVKGKRVHSHRSTRVFSSLQQRLYDRMVNLQGLSPAEATEVIKGNGYNKAASYGHMRAAGASANEAQVVIDLNDPSVSLAYGRRRQAGFDHTDSLSGALRQTQAPVVTIAAV